MKGAEGRVVSWCAVSWGGGVMYARYKCLGI